MNKTLNFFQRNLKETLRDPLMYIFCIGFPIIMLVIFNIINASSGNNTPMFELKSLLPGIITFSYTFIMLTMSLLVSKDRQSFFLKRLYSSPMKPIDFILGYSLVGFIIGLLQTVMCVLSAFIISIISNVEFISFGAIMLLFISQLPILIINIFIGILFGTLFNDKTAPAICSVFISLAGMLGGCWMPIETMGGFEIFCRCLPFYPSVYVGRIITGATNSLGIVYSFDNVALYGFIPIIFALILSTFLSIFVFKTKMVSDN